MKHAEIEKHRVPIAWLVSVVCVSFTGLGSAVGLGFYVAGMDAKVQASERVAAEAKGLASAASTDASEINLRLTWIEGVLEATFPETSKRVPRTIGRHR